jgi:hypothetical protein
VDPGERQPPTTGWTAARRRRLADQLAAEFAGALALDPAAAAKGSSLNTLHVRRDLDQRPVRRAIEQAWRLAVAPKLPPGTVQVTRCGRTTRVVRVNGDGWSLVASSTAEGPAVLLLDQLPATAVDLAGAGWLPNLLDGLVAVASKLA